MPFSATPRLYQEIRERGLNSTNQDELLDDFVVVEPPVEDQGIVVKSYRPAQLTWSQLPQVNLPAESTEVNKIKCKLRGDLIIPIFQLTVCQKRP